MKEGDYYMNVNLERNSAVAKILNMYKNGKVRIRYLLWNEGARYTFIETKEWIQKNFRPFPKLKGQLLEKEKPETDLERGRG